MDTDMHMRPIHRLGGYREWRPPAELSQAVEAVWTFRAPWEGDGTRPHSRHRVLPHNGPSLCFESVRGEDGRLVVMGPARTVRFYEPPEDGCLEAVRLKPEWMRGVLGIDGREHADIVESADTGPTFATLAERLRAGADGPALPLLLDHVRRRLAERRVERSATLAHAALEHVRGVGATRLELYTVSERLGVSERHLRRAVRLETGLSPKKLQRVERLNRVVYAADRARRPKWAHIAIEHGYSDQAHLAREVRTLTGRSPVALHAERALQRRKPPPYPPPPRGSVPSIAGRRR